MTFGIRLTEYFSGERRRGFFTQLLLLSNPTQIDSVFLRQGVLHKVLV